MPEPFGFVCIGQGCSSGKELMKTRKPRRSRKIEAVRSRAGAPEPIQTCAVQGNVCGAFELFG